LIAAKEKEDTESQKIVEPHDFSKKIQSMIKCFEDQQSRELRIIRTTFSAVSVYDNANEYS